MKRLHTYEDLVWLDLSSPSQTEVREIMDEYTLHPRIAEELLSPTFRPRMDAYKNCLFLILHFPALKHSHGNDHRQEMDFIIGKDFLITVRYDAIDALHKFSKEFEVSSVIARKDIGDHAGHIFYHLIKKMYKSLEHELEAIEDEIVVIETRIFEGKEREMVEEISRVSRTIIEFSQVLRPHEEHLTSLSSETTTFFGEDFTEQFSHVTDKYERIMERLKNLRETISEMRETNNSLLTTKQNEAMKILTIMAFVTFPLSLLASIFGMNTGYLPFVGRPHDFWIVMGIMTALTLIFFGFFKHRKWL